MNTCLRDTNLLIFTDMDGSLLDHYDYSHADADELLAELEAKQIPVIPATSKTSAELFKLRDELNNAHPFIAENGAAVYIPEGYFPESPDNTNNKGGFQVKEFTLPRQHWQALIASLQPEFGDSFTTFAQAGIEGIKQMTGLDHESALLAAQREYGEPVAWQGTEKNRQAFIEQLEKRGADILQGGRFMHVSGKCNKGQALQWLAKRYQAARPEASFTTLAIGDSQNDIAMLEAADMALIIRSSVHEMPKINPHKNCHQSTAVGPRGWVEGVKNMLGLLPDQNKLKI